MLDEINYHRLKWFTQPLNSYIKTWVWDIYAAYRMLFPNKRMKDKPQKTWDVLKVNNVNVKCYGAKINSLCGEVIDAH